MSEKEEGFDLSMLVNEADNTPEPDPEPQEEEQPDVEEEVDEVDEEDGELPEPEKAKSDSKRSELMDKELQQIQQLRATLAREVEKLQRQGSSPTEKQVERVEKAQSKLDKYLQANDVDPYQGVTDIAEEVLADRGRAEQALQAYEGKIRALEEREAAREAQLVRLQFTADYPQLRGRYDEFAQKVDEAMLDQFGSDLATLPLNVYMKMANREFMRLVNEASSHLDEQSQEKIVKPKDSAKKPKAARPIKSKSGGNVQPPQNSEALGEALLSQIGDEFFKG